MIQERGGKVTDYQIGDRVVIMPTFSCGQCFYCKTGNENLCPKRIDIGDSIDGGYAEYTRVPQGLLFKTRINNSIYSSTHGFARLFGYFKRFSE